MALDGERTIRKFTSIPATGTSRTAPSLPAPGLQGCCSDYIQQVLADNTGVPAQNDINTVLWYFGATVSNAVLYLQKLVNNTWVTVKNYSQLATGAYGTYNAFGYYTNKEGQRFISLVIDWSTVINDANLGSGAYKITVSYIDLVLGNGTIDSINFVLNKYSPLRANGWIRLEYWLSGVTEDITDDTLIKDYGTLNVYNSIRVQGYFGFPKTTYKTDTIEYDNGMEVWVEDRKEMQYVCQIKLTPEWIHEIIRVDFMMADQRAITDYNAGNSSRYVTKYIMKDSEYSPNYYPLLTNLSSVELKFKPQNNRSRKFRI